MVKKLNIRQQKFVQYYIESGNASESLLKAGYKYKEPHKVVPRFLNNPLIQDAVGKSRQLIQEQSQLTAMDIEKAYWQIAQDEGAKNADKINALGGICEMRGFNAPKKNVNTNINHNYNEENLKLNEMTKMYHDKLSNRKRLSFDS